MWGDVSSPRAGKRNVFSPRRSHGEKKSPRETSARSPRIVCRFLLLAIAKDSPREFVKYLLKCSGEDAYKKIRAGATLVQLYTAFAYGGPALIPQIKFSIIRLNWRSAWQKMVSNLFRKQLVQIVDKTLQSKCGSNDCCECFC
ncbi:hypothetical protein GW17_00018530 [Ensete ventricosum]|nr:hypothetical protein GW17_00018530 [Ensete ventricosum]